VVLNYSHSLNIQLTPASHHFLAAEQCVRYNSDDDIRMLNSVLCVVVVFATIAHAVDVRIGFLNSTLASEDVVPYMRY
jgi:hypothetical protein